VTVERLDLEFFRRREQAEGDRRRATWGLIASEVVTEDHPALELFEKAHELMAVEP
jgi:hypothetical protein